MNLYAGGLPVSIYGSDRDCASGYRGTYPGTAPAPVPFLPSVSQFESLSLFFRRPKNHLRKLKHRGNELNNDCGEKRPKRI
jgi:hypothetical protein